MEGGERGCARKSVCNHSRPLDRHVILSLVLTINDFFFFLMQMAKNAVAGTITVMRKMAADGKL